MSRVVPAVFAALALALPALGVAATKPGKSRPLPSSYAPQPHSGQHVYGSPIETHGVPRSQASRHKAAPAKHAAKAAPRDAHDLEAKNHQATPRRQPN